MTTFNPRLTGRKISGRDYTRPGSKQKLVSPNGDLNGYDKKDLMRTAMALLQASQDGIVDLDPNYHTVEAGEELTAAQKIEAMQAAFEDFGNGNKQAWGEIGQVLAGDIQLAVTRAGFMRNLLERNEVTGRVAQIRTRINNVTAVYMTTPSMLAPQYITDTWFTVPEFDIVEHVWVDGNEITYQGEQILQEQYDYGLEAFLACEDRTWKMLADSIVGSVLPLQVFTGDFTPDDLIGMQTMMITNGVTPVNVLMYFDYWQQFLNNSAFSNWFDPATRYEMLHSGGIGELLGLKFMTDGYRQRNLQVLQPGEIYMVAAPEQHGGYTDRGPINAVPVDGYNQGVDARGWFMKERLSMAIVNPASVIKGRRG